MIKRVLAALVGLAVLLPALFLGGELAVELLVPLIVLVCLDEYARMAFPDDHPASLTVLVIGGAGLYLPLLYLGDRWVPVFAVVVFVGVVGWVLFRRVHPIEGTGDRVGRLLTGIAWIAVLLAFLPLLRRLEDGVIWVVVALAIAWLGDTGGYFAGRAFGRHRLYPSVSPKKTWEGLFGGMALAVVGVLLLGQWALPALTVLDALVLGAGLSVAGVVGDLTESMFKRAYKVKDSGWIVPGHGGLLDRVDSVLFVVPLLYGYAVLIKGY